MLIFHWPLEIHQMTALTCILRTSLKSGWLLQGSTMKHHQTVAFNPSWAQQLYQWNKYCNVFAVASDVWGSKWFFDSIAMCLFRYIIARQKLFCECPCPIFGREFGGNMCELPQILIPAGSKPKPERFTLYQPELRSYSVAIVGLTVWETMKPHKNPIIIQWFKKKKNCVINYYIILHDTVCQSFVLVLAMSLSLGVSYPSLLSLSNALVCDIFSHLRLLHCWVSFGIQMYTTTTHWKLHRSLQKPMWRCPKGTSTSSAFSCCAPAALDMFWR